MSLENKINPESVEGTEQKRSERKSKLSAVREQILDKREEVFYAGEIVRNYGLDGSSGWAQTVDIIVSPNNTILNVEKLNRFMDSLVKNIEISARDKAYNHPDRDDIHLGKLYFDEPIGRVQRETKTIVTPIEKEALKEAEIIIGETHDTNEKNIMRRTWLRVYPDVSSARTIFNYEQGLKNGTVEPNPTLNQLSYHIEGEQVRKIREDQRKKSLSVITKILKGK